MPKTAGIILVGNEILSGKIQDTNAHYLCRELRSLGVDVRRIDVIPDEADVIATHVGRASAEFDVVFTSGGVGPTHDDVTIEGVARAMDVPVIRHPALVELLVDSEDRFAHQAVGLLRPAGEDEILAASDAFMSVFGVEGEAQQTGHTPFDNALLIRHCSSLQSALNRR